MRSDLEVLEEAVEAQNAWIARLEAENSRLKDEAARLLLRLEQAGEAMAQRDRVAAKALRVMPKRIAA